MKDTLMSNDKERRKYKGTAADRKDNAVDLRREDARGWVIHVRENWYRDVWLTIISLVCVLSIYAVQKSRQDITRSNCNATNTNNINTINAIKTTIDGLPPSQKKRAQAQLSSTILIINALAPVRNCDKAVAKISLW